MFLIGDRPMSSLCDPARWDPRLDIGGSVRGLFSEFKTFALGGNLVDLAIGIAIGAAFAAVVQSFVDDIILPTVAAIFGEPNFDALSVTIGRGRIEYGRFLTVLLGFLLLALVIMFLVKGIRRLTGVEAAGAQGTQECPHCLTLIPVHASVCLACTRDVQPVVP